MDLLQFEENGIYLVFEKGGDGDLRLLHCSPLPFDPARIPADDRERRRFAATNIHVSGADQDDHHGAKHCAGNPGTESGVARFDDYRDEVNEFGRNLTFRQHAGALQITSHYQFYGHIPVIRSWVSLANTGAEAIPLEYIASFTLLGLDKDSPVPWDECGKIHFARNSWRTEHLWEEKTLRDAGLSRFHTCKFGMQRLSFSSCGAMPGKEYLPMGIYEETVNRSILAWQIEHIGSWQWELSDLSNHLYLQLSGPNEREGHWFKSLRPGERFDSVKVAVAAVQGSAQDGIRALTAYRRAMRASGPDREELPIIFNDYMNCLMGEPTTEKSLPLIDLAATLPVDYYVMDAGWFASQGQNWWPRLGLWTEDAGRFPNGLKEVFDRVRQHGMKPGLWFELERIGKECRLCREWPAECFFRRHGKPVVEHASLQLDFRHPLVREHAARTVEAAIERYDLEYLKLDYNIEPGPGTEVDADSFGDGLYQHQQAYLSWLDELMDRHPELMIENCASGGMRNTYGILDRLPLASTTDNQGYLENAVISINSALAMTPEQTGVWVYPLAHANAEEVIMNMVNAMSWRIIVSGELWGLDEEKLNLMREGLKLYRDRLRPYLCDGLPVWPLGWAHAHAPEGAFALRLDDKLLLSVWNFTGDTRLIALPVGSPVQSCRQLYPAADKWQVPCGWGRDVVTVQLPPRSARIWELALA